MAAFNRKTELWIGIFKDEANVNSGYLIDELDYEFDITLSTDFYKSAATFTIYNPNKNTINEIMSNGTGVIFKAGYENGQFGTIFVGQVALVYTETEGPEEEKLIVICKSMRGAEYPLQRTYISAVVEEGKTVYDIVKTIADYVGLPMSGCESLKNYELTTSYIICGDVRTELMLLKKRKLASIGGTLIISNNELIYIGKDNVARFITVELGFNSGLISAKKKRDERYQSSEDAFNENIEFHIGLKKKYPVKLALQKAIEKTIPTPNEVEFQCLINHQVHIGQPVNIDARKNALDTNSVYGKFYVHDLHVTGDNWGGQFQMNGTAEEKTEMTAEQLKFVNSLDARLKAIEKAEQELGIS